MTLGELKAKFNALLAEKAGSADDPDPTQAYEAWVQFIRTPVECDDEGLLFEYGPRGEESFFFHVVRYCYADDGSYLAEASFSFPMDAELRAYQGEVGQETHFLSEGPANGEVIWPGPGHVVGRLRRGDEKAWQKFIDQFVIDIGDLRPMWKHLSRLVPTGKNVYVGWR